jgi:hypothetical protein
MVYFNKNDDSCQVRFLIRRNSQINKVFHELCTIRTYCTYSNSVYFALPGGCLEIFCPVKDKKNEKNA